MLGRAVVADDRAVLLPLGVDGFAPRLQPALARLGFALVDVAEPVVDLHTGELVVDPPLIDHDPAVLADAVVDVSGSASERPVVPPGRYPLAAWCQLHQMDRRTMVLTPAEAAASVVSTVLQTDDVAERLRELGAMFGRSPLGLAYWYDTEAEFFEVLRSVKSLMPAGS